VVENAVWAFCLDVARYPDKHLAELVARVQSQLREVVGAADDDNGEADELRRALLENEAERERAMLLFRKRLATWEETERALGEINRAKESLRTRLDELEAQRALVVLDTERLTSVAAGLAAWAETVEEADRTGDWHTKRAWVELLVRTIVATTVVQEGRKEAHLEVKVVAGPQPPQPKATAVSVLQRS
jgi:hypothetical protein